MLTTKSLLAAGSVLCGMLLAGSAQAEDQVVAVKQEFGKLEEVKEVVWKASASAGFSISTGNASVMTFSGGVNASRNDGSNKITLGLKGIYGLTDIAVFTDSDGDMKANMDSELTVERKRTAALLLGMFRYDRFFPRTTPATSRHRLAWICLHPKSSSVVVRSVMRVKSSIPRCMC